MAELDLGIRTEFLAGQTLFNSVENSPLASVDPAYQVSHSTPFSSFPLLACTRGGKSLPPLEPASIFIGFWILGFGVLKRSEAGD